MSDGSNLGITAARALGTILSGEPTPSDDEKQTPEQVRVRVDSATPTNYSGATDCMTRAVLRLFEQREETRVWPTSQTYEWPNGLYAAAVAIGPDLYAAAKGVATPPELEAFEGCTGFMWGFAVNQARWIMGQNPGDNPAIVTISVPD